MGQPSSGISSEFFFFSTKKIKNNSEKHLIGLIQSIKGNNDVVITVI
ncbi:MAG: hypothetical protein MUC80_03495 [Candidatus Thermoplasmatota archaeon]|nr:hypothetical protein [Candidatus Thermoplasmatota archaeon]